MTMISTIYTNTKYYNTVNHRENMIDIYAENLVIHK